MTLTTVDVLAVLLRERRSTEGFLAGLSPARCLDLRRDEDRNTYHAHAWLDGYQTALRNLALVLLGGVPPELRTTADGTHGEAVHTLVPGPQRARQAETMTARELAELLLQRPDDEVWTEQAGGCAVDPVVGLYHPPAAPRATYISADAARVRKRRARGAA